MSPQASGDDDDYRIIARYTLYDGRRISLRRKGSPIIEDAVQPPSSPAPSRRPSAAPASPAPPPQKKRPSLAPKRSSAAPPASASQPQPKQRPSLAPTRHSSASSFTTTSRAAPSDAGSAGSRDRLPPPKLPPRSGSVSSRPSAGSRSTSNTAIADSRRQSVQPRRPSTLGREAPGVPGEPSSKKPAAGMSSAPASGARRPSVPAKAASERPLAPSRSSSKAQDAAVKKDGKSDEAKGDATRNPSIPASKPSERQDSQPRKESSKAAPERPSAPSRASSKVQDAKLEEGGKADEGKGDATRRPSVPASKPSERQDSQPKKSPVSEDAKPERPSAPSRTTSEVQDPAPRRPSLGPKKSSQKLSRPGLKSTPSGRRVSFKEDERSAPEPPNAGPKLPDVAEEDSKAMEQPTEKAKKTPLSRKDSGRKPSIADTGNSKSVEKPTEKPAEKSKPPKLGKGGTKASGKPQAKQATGGAKAKPSQNPSEANKKPAKLAPKAKKPDTAATKKPDSTAPSQLDQKFVEKAAENDQDLKSFLSEEQRGDLTLLIADITLQMRRDIESHYDASKGLKLMKDDEDGGDILEKDLDFDPGTVDISKYEKERKLRAEQEKELAKPDTKKLKDSNIQWFDEWREVVILRVGEAVNSKKTASEQKKEASPQSDPQKAQRIQKVDAGSKTDGNTGPKLEDLFPRIKTPLTKLPMNKRTLVLHSMLLLLLSLEHYNGASRVLLLYLSTSLKIGLSNLRSDEEKTAQGLLKAAKEMTADEEASNRLKESDSASRKWKVRLATAAGAAVIGYTGGLAAPMIAAGLGSVMGELGLGATAAAGYLGTVASNTAVVGTLFGAYGGRMTGQVMENISAGVQDFGFLPIHGERKEHDDSVSAVTNTRRLRVVVAISGWLLEKEEVVTPWRVLKPSAEVFALRFELETLLNLGQSFDTMLQSAVYGYAQSSLVKQTVFSELMSGMMWPMALTKVARVVDNPFSLAQTRADKAGQVLADALINHVQGERPVTLIGYSLGARVIWSCLTSLAKRKAFGLVESAVLMGAPIPSDTAVWRSMRSTVSGRLVNVYSENDYLLAFLYRTSSLSYGVAGLVPITGLAGIENVDVTETVSGHLRYRYLVGSILQKIRFEDVDKEEVAKEAKAFETIIEEEKKRTYTQQASELYGNYKGKKPVPKATKKKEISNISDVDAEKQVSAMEKTVDEKTKTSLMQWAVEQLYLSSPSADKAKEEVAKEAKSPSSKKEDLDVNGKSYYQRVKEVTYISRSGGPEGEEINNAKQDHAQDADPEKPDEEVGYLSSAAGYIPSGYIPSLRSSKGAEDKNNDGAPKEEPSEEQGGEEDEEANTDTNISKSISHESAAEEATGYTSYLPSFGMGRSSALKKKSKGKGKGKQKEEISAEEAQQLASSAHASHSSNGEDDTAPEDEQGEAAAPEEGGEERNQAKAEDPAAEDLDQDQDSAPEDTPQEDTAPEDNDTPGAKGSNHSRSGFTTDTEGEGAETDGDPFVTPPARGRGGSEFEDRARRSGGG